MQKIRLFLWLKCILVVPYFLSLLRNTIILIVFLKLCTFSSKIICFIESSTINNIHKSKDRKEIFQTQLVEIISRRVLIYSLKTAL